MNTRGYKLMQVLTLSSSVTRRYNFFQIFIHLTVKKIVFTYVITVKMEGRNTWPLLPIMHNFLINIKNKSRLEIRRELGGLKVKIKSSWLLPCNQPGARISALGTTGLFRTLVFSRLTFLLVFPLRRSLCMISWIVNSLYRAYPHRYRQFHSPFMDFLTLSSLLGYYCQRLSRMLLKEAGG